jgi:hypothetical protein
VPDGIDAQNVTGQFLPVMGNYTARKSCVNPGMDIARPFSPTFKASPGLSCLKEEPDNRKFNNDESLKIT